jgi:hypothetical protein
MTRCWRGCISEYDQSLNESPSRIRTCGVRSLRTASRKVKSDTRYEFACCRPCRSRASRDDESCTRRKSDSVFRKQSLHRMNSIGIWGIFSVDRFPTRTLAGSVSPGVGRRGYNSCSRRRRNCTPLGAVPFVHGKPASARQFRIADKCADTPWAFRSPENQSETVGKCNGLLNIGPWNIE